MMDSSSIDIDFRSLGPGKRAHSLSELFFALSMRPCGACGTYSLSPVAQDIRRMASDGPDATDVYQVTILCDGCGRERGAIAYTVRDPIVSSQPDDLGSPEPSPLLSPAELFEEEARVFPRIASEPETLAPAEWKRSIDHLYQALTCVNELGKYAELGPVPGQYTLASIPAARAALHDLLDRYKQDEPRYQMTLAEEQPSEVPVGLLSKDAMQTHMSWLARGQVGEGRLVLENQQVRSKTLPALRAIRWENVEAGGIRAVLGDFSGSAFVATTWRDCNFEQCDFVGVQLQENVFISCRLQGASFKAARMSSCSFRESHASRSDWSKADCEAIMFDRCELQNATFDGARFKDCSFLGHRLDGTHDFAHLATTRGARFEDCDLRETDWRGRNLSGATFVRCKLAGAKGRPVEMVGVTLEGCDVSEDELRRMLAK